MKLVALMAAAGIALLAGHASAQTTSAPDVGELSLQDLLNVEVVSTASKFPQDVREAPASITVITSDEIRRQGHRTLADVLRGVRGMYTTYDRNYSYIGLRGFARPGDYNTRVLLLLDGHRTNDAIYDMAHVGTDFPLDVALIDRVEVIRGASSSLYGTNAFFAVINVISKTGAQRQGVVVDAGLGTLDTRGATVSFGRLFGNGSELMLAASAAGSAGARELRFSEFDGMGVATNLDDDRSQSLFASISTGHVAIRGSIANRNKQVPTASFGSVFGDDRLSTLDRTAFFDISYDGPVGKGWLGTLRTGYDYYQYAGDYPFDYGVFHDGADSHQLTTELNVRRRIARSHMFTVGTEARTSIHAHQWASDVYGTALDENAPGTSLGVYVQDEVRVQPWLLVSGGARIDRYPSFGTYTSPRGAIVLMPRQQTTIKLLHGRAFRAPNAYELYYYDVMRDGGSRLQPETSRSTEVVWEEFLSSRVRSAVSAFHYDARNVIEQRSIISGDGNDDLYFANGDTVRGKGIEAEIEAKLPGGLNARYSQTYARTSAQSTGAEYSNSPRHLAKASVQFPIRRFYLGLEGQYVGRRQTITGASLDGFFVPNITLTSPEWHRMELSVSVYNATNTAYADPGAEEHVQQSIPQDRRTAMARLRIGF